MNILVIDVGTSSMRGILFHEQGRQLDVCQLQYQVETPRAGIVEQDPKVWTDALIRICRSIAERAAGKGYSVDGMALTCQRSSIIPVDQEGNPLRKAIMWQDMRNREVVQSLMPCHDRIEELTGARLNTVFSGSKMIWLKRYEKDIYQKAYKICTIADFLTRFMTGEFVTDETYGSRSHLMGINSRRWEPELLDIFEVSEEKLCKIIKPGDVSGRITALFAKQTGLPEGIPLVSAGGDQQCGALGLGVYQTGRAEITVGTGAFVLQQIKGPMDIRGKGIVCGVHAVPGAYVLETSVLAGAALYNWAAKTLFSEENYKEIDQAVSEVPPGSNGCMCIPYFQGRGTPDWNNNIRGAFLNLELGTTKGVMARALLESIAYEVSNNIEVLIKYAGEPEEAYIGGGLTKQPQFCQILSDVTGMRISHEIDCTEQTARGAWMSAAVTLGICRDYAEAHRRALSMIRTEEFVTDPEHHGIYGECKQRMNAYYQKIQ